MINDDEFMKQTYSCRQHILCGGRLIVEHYWDKERFNVLPKVGIEFRRNGRCGGIALLFDFLGFGASACIILRRKRP